MTIALKPFDYYDLMGSAVDAAKSAMAAAPQYFFVDNLDPSTLTESAVDEGLVYTEAYSHGTVTIMSAFRKDLFISVTLPVLLAALGSVALGLTAYTHVDSKLDAAKSEASSGVDHLGDTLRQELRADREARAKEFEAIRLEMREDRKDMRDAIKGLTNRT